MVGQWELSEMKIVDLPEKVATAFNQALDDKVGAKFEPVLFCGEQIVHGINYMFICKETLSDREGTKQLVKVVVNELDGACKVVLIDRIL